MGLARAHHGPPGLRRNGPPRARASRGAARGGGRPPPPDGARRARTARLHRPAFAGWLPTGWGDFYYTNTVNWADGVIDNADNAAARLGYRLNAAARATSTGRYGAAGMVFGREPVDSYVEPMRLDALLRVFGEAGMNLCLSCLDDAFLTDETAVAGALSRLYADGLLVAYNARVPAAFRRVTADPAAPVPSVAVPYGI